MDARAALARPEPHGHSLDEVGGGHFEHQALAAAKYASWIAPPAKGLDYNGIDYEYVRMA